METKPDSPVKLIIAGGRDLACEAHVFDAALALGLHRLGRTGPVEVVSGRAAGADTLGEDWARRQGHGIQPFPADWKDLTAPGAVPKQGRYGMYNAVAGHQRNERMADYADALLAFWDGKSTGTRDMINRARRHNLQVAVVSYDELDELAAKGALPPVEATLF